MVRLENNTFLESLTKLFQNNRAKGNVILTMKRYDGKTKPTPSSKKVCPAPSEYLCLIRAYCSKNKKNKISTVVNQKEAVKFQIAYTALLKSNIDGLKKSKKVKKAKA